MQGKARKLDLIDAMVMAADDKVSEADVLASLKQRLANYKLPKRVLVVDELPRNAMGKVQKNLLRDAYRDLYTG